MRTGQAQLCHVFDSGIEKPGSDGIPITFADSHVRHLPRSVSGPFHYRTPADVCLETARRHAYRPVKQAVISASALNLPYPRSGVYNNISRNGIGLSICRSIIEAHNGRLWSEPAARYGSVFQIDLPTAVLVPDEWTGGKSSSSKDDGWGPLSQPLGSTLCKSPRWRGRTFHHSRRWATPCGANGSPHIAPPRLTNTTKNFAQILRCG
jgi:hypothetical protein